MFASHGRQDESHRGKQLFFFFVVSFGVSFFLYPGVCMLGKLSHTRLPKYRNVYLDFNRQRKNLHPRMHPGFDILVFLVSVGFSEVGCREDAEGVTRGSFPHSYFL